MASCMCDSAVMQQCWRIQVMDRTAQPYFFVDLKRFNQGRRTLYYDFAFANQPTVFFYKNQLSKSKWVVDAIYDVDLTIPTAVLAMVADSGGRCRLLSGGHGGYVYGSVWAVKSHAKALAYTTQNTRKPGNVQLTGPIPGAAKYAVNRAEKIDGPFIRLEPPSHAYSTWLDRTVAHRKTTTTVVRPLDIDGREHRPHAIASATQKGGRLYLVRDASTAPPKSQTPWASPGKTDDAAGQLSATKDGPRNSTTFEYDASRAAKPSKPMPQDLLPAGKRPGGATSINPQTARQHTATLHTPNKRTSTTCQRRNHQVCLRCQPRTASETTRWPHLPVRYDPLVRSKQSKPTPGQPPATPGTAKTSCCRNRRQRNTTQYGYDTQGAA
ncbi:hypothetical protein FQA39_LY18743 [Lamprigera yunnana]|nr:hypothetical protein FQA39_LY18743 [Lamprigera yunnana]